MRLEQTEKKITLYLSELDTNYASDLEEDDIDRIDKFKEKITQIEEKKQHYEHIQEQMKTTGQREVSLVDPDSRLMRVDSQRLEVCYNIQTSVDAKQYLIVDYDVTNNSTDHHRLVKELLFEYEKAMRPFSDFEIPCEIVCSNKPQVTLF